MDPEEFEVGVLKPEGTVIDARIFAKYTSLIRIRRDFIAEIVRSAEAVESR